MRVGVTYQSTYHLPVQLTPGVWMGTVPGLIHICDSIYKPPDELGEIPAKRVGACFV